MPRLLASFLAVLLIASPVSVGAEVQGETLPVFLFTSESGTLLVLSPVADTMFAGCFLPADVDGTPEITLDCGVFVIATTTYVSDLYSLQSGTTTKHIFAGGILIATIEGNGTATNTRSIHPDHLGGTHTVTNASGTVVQTLDYYPFGSRRINTGTDVSSREFIGEVFDESAGLSYLNARYYTGDRGQFVSQDPVFWEVGQTAEGKGVLANPQLQNSYSYAGNNPIKDKDPSGRLTVEGSFNYQGTVKGPTGVSAGYGIRVEILSSFGYQTVFNYGVGVGKGATLQAKISPFGTLDPEGEYVSVEGVVARGFVGGAVSQQAPYDPSNPFNFTSDKARTSVGWAVGLQSGVSYSNVVVGQPKYFFRGDSSRTVTPPPVGNSGSGKFIGTYDFGPDTGTYDYGKGKWLSGPFAQSTPATINKKTQDDGKKK